MSGFTTDVLIVGAGPVGLTTAALLGDLGVQCIVVERSAGLSTHPRASGIHGRTMEVFRQLRIADAVRAAGVPDHHAQGFGWYRRLSESVLAELRFDDESAPDPPVSPEHPCFCPQTHYEPVLLDAATGRPGIQVAFNTEAVRISHDADGVTIETATGSDRPTALRGRYLVAADGPVSSVREWLGLGETGTAVFGHSVNVHFRADLGPAVTASPYMLFWIEGPGAGTFARADADGSVWTYNFAAEPDREYRIDELTARVRAAAGMPDLQIEVLGTHRWDYDQSVTNKWRSGRVLLVGDAAHRFPPHGAFGMNSGVQDAQNLAWKLAAVIRGTATDALLDSYESERKPVAQANGRQALLNTEGVGPGNDRPTVDEIVAGQRQHLHSLGQQFGIAYVSTAVIPDGTPAVEQTVSRYTPTARPGSRAPHIWLRDQHGAMISSVDLSHAGFALLAAAPGESWHRAVSDAAEHGLAITFHSVGPGGELTDDADWAARYGVSDGGAVLVRPDGYVGARFVTGDGDDLGARLVDTMTRILRPDEASSGSGLHTTSPQVGSNSA